MTGNQKLWALARNRLAEAVASLGYPEDFADLLADPRGNRRLARKKGEPRRPGGIQRLAGQRDTAAERRRRRLYVP